MAEQDEEFWSSNNKKPLVDNMPRIGGESQVKDNIYLDMPQEGNVRPVPMPEISSYGRGGDSETPDHAHPDRPQVIVRDDRGNIVTTHDIVHTTLSTEEAQKQLKTALDNFAKGDGEDLQTWLQQVKNSPDREALLAQAEQGIKEIQARREAFDNLSPADQEKAKTGVAITGLGATMNNFVTLTENTPSFSQEYDGKNGVSYTRENHVPLPRREQLPDQSEIRDFLKQVDRLQGNHQAQHTPPSPGLAQPKTFQHESDRIAHQAGQGMGLFNNDPNRITPTSGATNSVSAFAQPQTFQDRADAIVSAIGNEMRGQLNNDRSEVPAINGSVGSPEPQRRNPRGVATTGAQHGSETDQGKSAILGANGGLGLKEYTVAMVDPAKSFQVPQGIPGALPSRGAGMAV